MAQDNFIQLSMLNQLIKEVVQGNFMEDVWLVAEISDVRSASSGHCYLELVEKTGEKVVARIKANVWSFQYHRISSSFYNVTGKQLEKGMKILLSASVSFHELYGMSLVVKDINPEFTLGDLEKSKREILNRLKKEGYLDKNKQLDLAIIPKRIAVVSSKSAAGFEDFMNHLQEVSEKYKFEVVCFEALMQGEKVGQSVIQALSEIKIRKEEFDSVAIIRGGGASLDLSGFDDYKLAVEIATFPLPVFSGIGHERDFTVLDHVVHTRLKTPTAVAAFYIQQFDEFSEYINELKDALVYLVQNKLFKEKERSNKYRSNFVFLSQEFTNRKKANLQQFVSRYQVLSNRMIQQKKNDLKILSKVFGNASVSNIKKEYARLESVKETLPKLASKAIVTQQKELLSFEKQLKLLDPIHVLNRGFAVVKRKDGTFVKGVQSLKKEEELSLQLKDGTVTINVK